VEGGQRARGGGDARGKENDRVKSGLPFVNTRKEPRLEVTAFTNGG